MLAFNKNMKLIIIHKNKNLLSGKSSNLLRTAICSEPLCSMTLSCLNGDIKCDKRYFRRRGNINRRGNNNVIAIPQDWACETTKAKADIIYYSENLPIPLEVANLVKANPWFIISNGRSVTQIDYKRLYDKLAESEGDVISVNVVPQLQATCERALITSPNKLVGFRRFYNDLVLPAPIPDDWPHHVFIKTNIFNKLLVDDALPLDFSKFINNCLSNSLTIRSINISGAKLDLETEAGLLAFFTAKLNSSMQNHLLLNNKRGKILSKGNIKISDSARLFGKVLLGQNISIGQNVIIVGPTIIGDNVKIAKGTVIRTSIIGPDISVSQNHLIQNRVFIDLQNNQKTTKQSETSCMIAGTNGGLIRQNSFSNNFRTWPRLSYTRCFKRITDIAAAITVLILFAPVIPIIALVIKLTSSGPIFFKDKRQGLHGRMFNCIKFRTMLSGSDKVQDKLRVLNQADGPQFKMSNDPRLSIVGRFLRDTYIDEIPQFFNVLLGHMSVVGPRPSPEQENIMCPSWRDARLSVRPGITGLWQVYRTREPMKDFQEWIYYDTKYVRDLSLRMDLRICFQTVKKMVKNFMRQF
jgi:lipopolysaccharide/colanic/teichoic acid biosynthesis glycosyltransferase